MNVSGQKASVIFQKMIVNHLEDTSGIFIGTNQAIGWSTIKKTNQGFGELSHTVLSNAVGVLHDEDIVDFTIQDYHNIILTEVPNNQQQCAIHFGSLQTNSLINSCAIDLGDNKQLGWRTARKDNFGVGKPIGINSLKRTIGVLNDNDAVDATIITNQHDEDISTVIKNILITQDTEET
ncbi:hypothetical protein AWU65_09445 [Paenibacillus glucanolyticus]|uniref:Uncharacterized protein n=1 Tax=Paenibacillus glucanolyticus TaxID=59843 RepID=A0A163IST7_9BACL|nr:hypothetical protein [Paenibacillus glucanolyticus]KZS46132.1 hypothetical protein AWU65_09445 [Paenibacillus glucanolyticus]